MPWTHRPTAAAQTVTAHAKRGVTAHVPRDATDRRYLFHAHHGGGWTLAAKVHRARGAAGNPEPNGWFAATLDTAALLNDASYSDRPTWLASHGQARLAPVATAARLARFVLIAEDDPLQRANWFKRVDNGVWAWFSATDHAATEVCADVEMTRACATGKIRSVAGNVTSLDNMILAHHGYGGGGAIHMRLDSDASPSFNAVCSSTGGNDSNAWLDDAIDGHWGNGLEVWFR